MRRKSWRVRALLAGAAAFSSGAIALADHTTATWNEDAISSWTNAAAWSSNPSFPNNSGSNTFSALINSTGAVVDLNAPITISGFGMLAGTLSGNGQLTVTGVGSWLGGTLSGNGTINIANSLLIDGGLHSLSNYTINIGSLASAAWASHEILALPGVEGGVINNAGTFEDQTDDDWYWDNVKTPVFNNTGLFRKSAGSDQFAKNFWAATNNSGQVDVETSGIWFAGGGYSTGSFNVSGGAYLHFSDFNENFSGAGAPTTVFASSAVVNSIGTVVFNNSFGNATTEFNGTYNSIYTVVDAGTTGLVRFTNSASLGESIFGDLFVRSGEIRIETPQATADFNHVELSGGTINTASSDLFVDHLTWSGGAIRGNGTNNASTGELSFTGTDFKQLSDINFYNGIGSHATISEGSLSMVNASVHNLAGATFDFQDDAALVNDDAANFSSSFFNDGTLIKSGGSGVSELADVYIANSGTIIAQSGTLRLKGTGEHTGTMLISGGATIDLGIGSYGSQHTFSSGALVSGETGSTLHISGFTSFLVGSSASLDQLTVDDFLDVAGTISSANMHVQNGGYAFIPGGTFSASGKIEVGHAGGGRMDVLVGGRVNSHDGFIAPVLGSDGSVNIDGVPSAWILTGDLYVGGGTNGTGGNGALTASHGGYVGSVNGYVASRPGSIGVVNITAANTPGATGAAWVMDGSFFVGGNATAAGGIATVTVGTEGSIVAYGSTKIWNQGVVHYNDGTFSTGPLTLAGGGDFIMAPGSHVRLIVQGAISTDAANGSKLDVADNSISLFSSLVNPSSSIRQQIQAGYHDGDWAGNGITTSMGDAVHGLGYKGGSFAMDIKYAYFGDADLSGFVDVADLYAIASHYNTSGDFWTQGDFNYDGTVNIVDLKMMAKNWGAGIGAPLPAPSLAPILASLGLPNVEVPEPAGLGVLVLSGALLKRRVRNQ